MTFHKQVIAAALAAHLFVSTVARGAERAGGSRVLADLSLEELMNESVTSVSKKETKLSQSPAAISVITQEDIRRSGLATTPELLRTVPGLDVARINANEWAVSSRGFNHQFANKLLVLIDGRTIYTPASGGVFWNAQDVVLEDLDRIEVIRGPGATLWGGNAVNGVINIITKSAKETQGALVSTSFGTEDHPSTTVRYGGQLATNFYYRAYVKYFNRDGLVDANGDDAPDDWSALRGGLRLNWEPSPENNFTLQGDYYDSDAGKNMPRVSLTPPSSRQVDVTARNSGGNVVGRWARTFSETSQLTLQGYYDHVEQGDGAGTEFRNTGDIDLQHRFALGARNDVVWGAGYRYATVESTPSFNLTWTPDKMRLQLFNVFVQDEITLVPDQLHFTLGSKFEHNTLTGLEIQPSARLLWTPTERQTAWASVSRATRTPSLFERNIRLNAAAFQPSPFAPPVLVSSFGNPNAEAEKLIAYELGYRIEPMKQLSFDVAMFYNVYEDLLLAESNPRRDETSPAPPHTLISTTIQNNQHGETYGTEVSAQWKVTDNWRLAGSYTWLHMRLAPDSSTALDSPQHQFQLRSYLDLPGNVELNGALFYVSEVSPHAAGARVPVPSYVRLDIGVVWRPTPSLELGVWGQNLLDDRHAEFRSIQSGFRTEVPRGVLGKITWRF